MSYSIAHRPQLRSRRQSLGLQNTPSEWARYLGKHNELAQFTADLVAAAHAAGASWVIENPADRGDRRSPAFWEKHADHAPLWLQPAVATAIAGAAGARKATFAQCAFGATTQKWTTVAYSSDLEGLLAPLRQRPCDHGATAHDGRAHGRAADGSSLSAASAAYPLAMNAFLASALTARARERREEEGQHQLSRGAARGEPEHTRVVAGDPVIGLGLRIDRAARRIDCPPLKRASMLADLAKQVEAAREALEVDRDRAETLVGRLVNISQILPELKSVLHGGYAITKASWQAGGRRRRLRRMRLRTGSSAQTDWLGLLAVAAELLELNVGVALAPELSFPALDELGMDTVTTDASGIDGVGGYLFDANSPGEVWLVSEKWPADIQAALDRAAETGTLPTGGGSLSMPAAELFGIIAVADAVASERGRRATAITAIGDCAPAAAALNAATSPTAQMRSILREAGQLTTLWLGVAVPRELNVDADLAPRARQLQAPPGTRRLKRGIRAAMLRSLAAIGYDRSSARGMIEWAAALVAHNLLLRGGELGVVEGKQWDATRDASFGVIEFKAPCADSNHLPWLTWDVVPIKDVVARRRVCPMAVRRRQAGGAIGSDPLCTYDAVVLAWRASSGTEPPTLGRVEGALTDKPFFLSRSGAEWNTIDTRQLAQAMARALGLEPYEFGASSFRIGGATDWRDVFKADAERIITQRGRWHSDIAFIYQRALAEAHLSGSAAVGDAAGADLETLCKGWVQPASFR
eukprot:jgi/Chrpa1/15241/Chrysochromulina_OHIO_Genome00022542-RA